MSDFLSNFDKKNYKKTLDGRDDKEIEVPSENAATPQEEEITSSIDNQHDLEEHQKSNQIQDNQHEPEEQLADESDRIVAEARKLLEEQTDEAMPSEAIVPEADEPKSENKGRSLRKRGANRYKPDQEENLPTHTTRGGEEETEVDPTYKNRRKRKIVLISVASVISAILLGVIFYVTTHVKMPDFNKKNVSEVREWAAEYKMKLDLKQEYDFDNEVNTVTKQSVKAGKQIKKKGDITITSSLGPDPEDVIPLPDFSKMSKAAADEWVLQNKADNLSVLEEYSDTVDKTKFVRQEINNKEVTAETYKREDKAIVYYSKGKEVFKKDIAMPDFKGKPKSDVEAWVKTNEIKMEYKKVDSDKVEIGSVVTQEIEKGKKVAKRDSMSVSISTGPAVIVPNFAEYNPDTAATVEGLSVNVKTVFSTEAPYGQLLSQSVEAGKKVSVSEKEPQKITVTYSAGQPYLRSYFGELEGDLDKHFYEDYRSKGAQIYFNTYYVDSDQIRGTVVKMDAYNQYVPLEFTVNIGISNGSRAETPTGRASSGNDSPEPSDASNDKDKTPD